MTKDNILFKIHKKWNNSASYEDNESSYAYGLCSYKLMWLFIIGSVAGYLLETIWYYSLRGYYVNRQGVLYGPFSPIYGVAFVMFAFFLYKIKNSNSFNVFIIAGIMGSTFEYICSILQENLLGTRSWNYSKMPLNIEGRVCLRFTIFWGILGMIFIKHTYPFLSKCIENIKPKIGKCLAIILFVFLTIDCALSIAVSSRQNARRNGVEPANAIESFFDNYYTDEKLNSIYTEIRIVD